jgi:hypothetical protein
LTFARASAAHSLAPSSMARRSPRRPRAQRRLLHHDAPRDPATATTTRTTSIFTNPRTTYRTGMEDSWPFGNSHRHKVSDERRGHAVDPANKDSARMHKWKDTTGRSLHGTRITHAPRYPCTAISSSERNPLKHHHPSTHPAIPRHTRDQVNPSSMTLKTQKCTFRISNTWQRLHATRAMAWTSAGHMAPQGSRTWTHLN